MTDITELAQSLKAAADKATPGPWGVARDSKTLVSNQSHPIATVSDAMHRMLADGSTGKDAEFIALANPANIRALVEALEKAQQYAKERDAENQDLMLTVGRLRVEREELESRTVKLPKPHAHLIWIQAGHAPDDYWDDVAVSHSEKDRCCDGSERYPIYARWEIEEMLTAAGIKVEAE
ncbi:TPA: ead/Ea22-like family protein [Klebsiella pneumoniae]|uniref:ead/Ea22-like family protein n=1 Tax=Klebsiella pneumoniae TaxID=573 RepID=UPI0031225713|nr:ead/Ea22-like family protein [Klebsiella pneumoniae subsp. pneumoniae]